MSAAALPVPDRIARFEKSALAVGGVALALTLLGWLLDQSQFFRSYLLAFLFWSGVAVGCLSIIMIQHLTGGLWGVLSRRILEAGSRTFPLIVALFVPVLLGLHELYVWTHVEVVAEDPIVAHKAPYLNVPFFVARAAFYFAVWLGLAHFLNKWSLALDAGFDRKLARRLRSLSGGGLVLMGLTISFASVDWGMSLNPHWFSTIYGVLFMVGQALSALAFVIVVVARLGGEAPLDRVASPTAVHDLGKLMLAFVMLWGYVNLSQFIIVWSGNIPEENPFYIARLSGGWQFVALALVALHFALPFLVLLSRDLKRNAARLGAIAGVVFLARLVDLFWLLGPDLAGHGGDSALHVHWLDVTAPLGLGGLWLWAFARQLRGRPLLPLGDPDLRQAQEAQEARA